jgi:hypothetical protein
MQAISSARSDVVAKLVPGGAHSLAHLSDQELLTHTRRLVGKSNQLFAALLVHLAEVETRGLHRKRLCASLYTYCIYELRFSEDAAARRSSAARLVKQFPILFDAIASGELHLTGLLMLGPHLTPENHVEVLGRAKFRTKKEIAKLVRELNPLPEVPDLIQPLRPASAPPLATNHPSWEHFASSWEPTVRELPPGERPREWANDVAESSELEAEPDPLPPAPKDLPPITGAQQYQMQFTTSEEHVQLVERAKALLARERPGATLGKLHLEAMKMLVAALEKRKFAVTDRPRKRAKSQVSAVTETAAVTETDVRREAAAAIETAVGPQPAAVATAAVTATAVEPAAALLRDAPAGTESAEPSPCGLTPRRRGRYVPAAERRTLFKRDGGRCTYVDSRGERCRETHYLEIQHLKPFARGGAHVASNLTLRCAAHNALAAERDFGRDFVTQKRDSTRHESFAAQAADRSLGVKRLL